VEFEETCRKLKPLIGGQADRYLQAYLAEDSKGRTELRTAVELVAARLLGKKLDRAPMTLSAPPSELANGDFNLGQVMYAWKPLHPFGILEEEWIQHLAIFGRSGAGKTNTTLVLLDALRARGKPFTLFDWKRNYRDLLAMPQRQSGPATDAAGEIQSAIEDARRGRKARRYPSKADSQDRQLFIFTVGRDVVPFTFNPLIPPAGTDPYTWLKKLIEIIAHAYYLGEGVMFLLQEALHAIYTECGMYGPGQPTRVPVIKEVLNWLVKHPVKGRRAQWMDSTLRGIQSLCFGHMGDVVNATEGRTDIAVLLEEQVILELDALTAADKTFLIEALLLWIHHYRLGQGKRESFKHALIIEEAHHILLKRTAGRGGEAVTDTILREIRELGEAVVLVDQHPSLISVPAMGNTYTTVAMNLKHQSDVSAVGAAMLLDQEGKDLLGQLPVGWAIVKLQGRWTEPFVIQVPHLQLPKGKVDDQVLKEKAKTWGLAVQSPAVAQSAQTLSEPSPRPPPIPSPSKRDLAILQDVGKHPLSGVVERYRRLGLNRRKGNTSKEACIEKGLMRQVPIPTRSGRVMLLELTDDGRDLLKEKGIATESPGLPAHSGGLEHEYWRACLARMYGGQGYNVTMEVPANGYADLVLEKDGRRIAVEVETGKSNWRDNMARDLSGKFNQVIVVCTNEGAYAAIRSMVDEQYPDRQSDLDVVRAQDICGSG